MAGKTALGASSAEKALNKKYKFDGEAMSVAEFVERPDFINASPKLRINGYFFKKRFYRLMFLCQKERFCKKTAVFR